MNHNNKVVPPSTIHAADVRALSEVLLLESLGVLSRNTLQQLASLHDRLAKLTTPPH